MQIEGLEGLTGDELALELERGGRFVIYTFTISVLVMTFRQPTNIMFLRGDQSRFARGLPYSMLTFFLGWWGFPWGPIYSIWTLVENCAGGKDVTQEVVMALMATVDSEEGAAGEAIYDAEVVDPATPPRAW